MVPLTRCQSKVFVSFPWLTDAVVSNVDLVAYFGEAHHSLKFLTSLKELEKNILNDYSINTTNLRKSLCFQDGDCLNISTIDKTTAIACVSYICANRLVDIMAWLEGTPQELPVPMHRRQGNLRHLQQNNTLNKTWRFLEQWPTLVQNFCNLSSKEREKRAHYSSPTVVSPLSKQDHCFSLLDSVAEHIDNTGLMKIYGNIGVAAFHLSMMFRGLPDLPPKIDWFLTPENQKNLTEKSHKFLQDMYSKDSPHRYRLPLQLSFLITPLYLLVPVQMQRKDWDRLRLLLTSKYLGNQRPALLIQVEKVMWRALCRIARGEVSLEAGVEEILAEITPEFLQSLKDIDGIDRYWFSVSTDLFLGDGVDGTRALNLHEADIESDVPDGWPSMFVISPIPTLADRPSTPHASEKSPDKESNVVRTQMPTPASTPSPSDVDSSTNRPLRRSSRNADAAAVDYSGKQAPTPSTKSKPSTRLSNSNDRASTGSSGAQNSPAKKTPLTSNTYTPPSPTSSDNKPDNRGSRSPDQKAYAQHSNSYIPQHVGSSPEEPITLDIIEVILQNLHEPARPKATLKILQENRATFQSSTKVLRDPYGQEISVEMMAFHTPAQALLYRDLVDAIESYYIDDTPLHALEGQSSSICVIDEGSLAAQSIQHSQSIFSHQHVLITDLATEPLKFDEKGLQTIKSIDQIIDIYDYSYKLDDSISDDRFYMKTGSLYQMLEATRSESLHIMSTTDIAMPLSGILEGMAYFPFSTDVHAWQDTENCSYCLPANPFPVESVRWGSASTKGSITGWKLAPHGFGHYIDVKVGSLLLIIAKSKPNDREAGKRFTDINLFANNFRPDKPNTELWDLEAVVLTPGTRMVLRPNTPYRCISLEHTICRGGRFYATSTLQDTAIGLMHSFINVSLTGGVSVPSFGASRLLRRIMLYFHRNLQANDTLESHRQHAYHHMPDLSRTTGMFNLLSLFVIMIFLNVLDADTYEYPDLALVQYDQNKISPADRTGMMYARGKAIHSLDALFNQYQIIDLETSSVFEDPFTQVIFPHLIRLQVILAIYKKQTAQEQPSSTTSCTSSRFKGQLENALNHFDYYEKAQCRFGQELKDALDDAGFNLGPLSNDINPNWYLVDDTFFEVDVVIKQLKLDSLEWDRTKYGIIKSSSTTREETPDADHEIDFIFMGSSRADITYKKYHRISEYSGYLTYDTLSQTRSMERYDCQEPSLKRQEPDSGSEAGSPTKKKKRR